MKSIKHYRHVIWDWNGTLLDDAWLCIEITNSLLRPRGLELLTPDRYQRLFDFPVLVYYERMGFDLEAESFEKLGSAFIESYDRRRFECELQPHAVDALDAVRRAGMTQSILSAYKRQSLTEIAAHFGLAEYFVDMIGLDDHYAAGKVDHGKAFIARLPHASREVLLVGDTVHDYEVADAMGADCLLIPSGHHSVEKLSPCGAPMADSLGTLVRLLNEGARGHSV
jgi:phosphoglycolate phosphatase